MTALLARWIVPALVLVALPGCGQNPERGSDAILPDPPFYEISSADGIVEGWLLGTIHARPDDGQWRTPAIDRAVNEADYLLLEVAGLRDAEQVNRVFNTLATTPGQPDLRQRVTPARRAALDRVLREADRSPGDYTATETWAAALILAREGAPGDPANGVDRELIGEFADRDVRELEGVQAQLRIFDGLPEKEQRDLLEGVLAELEDARTRPGWMYDAWLSGDQSVLIEATRSGILADPELREALLLRRNRDWSGMLEAAIARAERPLIAVGAGHLVGPDGLVAMLEDKGYIVRRVRR